VRKIELRNRILTEYPHVKARLKRVTQAPGASLARWRIRIEGAANAQEVQEINRWAQAANILPDIESHAE
jgi:hypothetical protein